MKQTTRLNNAKFDPKTLATARETAARYRVVLEPQGAGGFVGSAIELPRAFGEGPTADTCLASTREAVSLAIAALIRAARPVPQPLGQSRRHEQVNVRLTAEEKLRLQHAAKAKGFQGMADFLRTAALATLDPE